MFSKIFLSFVIIVGVWFHGYSLAFADCITVSDGSERCVELLAAADTLGDITKSDFTISLSNLDPVNQAASNTGDGLESAKSLIEKAINLFFIVMPLVAGVSLVVAGYYYILSGGDSEKASRAKTIIKWNAVAIAVALLSYVMIKIIATFLDGVI